MNIRSITTPTLLTLVALVFTACGDASAGGVIAGGIGIYLIGSILLLILLIYAVLDLVKQPYPMQKKLIWGAIIFFIPYLGAILYLIMGRNGKEVF